MSLLTTSQTFFSQTLESLHSQLFQQLFASLPFLVGSLHKLAKLTQSEQWVQQKQCEDAPSFTCFVEKKRMSIMHLFLNLCLSTLNKNSTVVWS